MNESTIIHTVPAADALHKVPGFNPLDYLRKTVNAQGEPVMRLEPRYQRLWFRLACPKGRMLLNPLRVTDQLAIFEAKVFFHMDDPTPASSFTSNKTVQEAPNYIRAAQDEALKEALDNAGFGIQLCDVTQNPDEEAPIVSVPLPQVKITTPDTEKVPVDPPQDDLPPVSETTLPPAPEQVQEERAAEETVLIQETTPPEENTVLQEEHPEPQNEISLEISDPDGKQQSVVSAILNFPPQTERADPHQETGTESTDTVQNKAEAPKYTDDMPVEDILQLMTLEEARAFVVTKGPCAGWTLEKVAERRTTSLRFFLSECSNYGNIQKAAATLLIQELDQKKAG